MERKITEQRIKKFKEELIKAEKRKHTIDKYIRDIGKLRDYIGDTELTKEAVIQYKEYLEQCGRYKIASINSFLAVVNHFCEVLGWSELRIKMIKVQHEIFTPENKELTIKEYERLICTALKRGDKKLALIIQTLGSTGIRISELCYITTETLKVGMADIYNKGKIRRILYPTHLVLILKEYVLKENIKSGYIFCTRNGNPINRSNIWRAMKNLCKEAKVDEKKVYPHNMRHLFARCFYKLKSDIAKLADVLGHSSIETTRIYIKTTWKEHKRQLDMMGLVLLKTLSEKQDNNPFKNTIT